MQTARQSSLLNSKGAVCDLRYDKVSKKKNEVSDQKNGQSDTVSSDTSSAFDRNYESDGAFEGSSHMPRKIRPQTPRHPSLLDRGVEEANQEPRRSIHKVSSAVPKDQTRSSQNCHQRASEIDAINGGRFPKVSKEEDKFDEHDCQTMLSRTSSARDSKLESHDAFEGGNRSAQFKKPLMEPHEPIRFRLSRPSVLDRRGALDAISESRLFEGASTSKSSLATVPLGNGKPTIASLACTSQDNMQTWKGETYITTLGPGGGYGYPHPPPFYRCEVCLKETAFYRLKCCHMVVCECCGCPCEPAEIVEDKKSQYQSKKVMDVKEKLPKVKLDGSDLFLWQPCSFPSRLMLCMAKRTGNNLKYYFAAVNELMDPKADPVEVCVYDFWQQGHRVISLSKTEQLLARNLLR